MENALVLQTANLMKTKKEIYSLPTERKKHFFGVSTIIDGTPVLKSSIQYLDCIDTPAAKMTTIYQGSEGFFSLLSLKFSANA